MTPCQVWSLSIYTRPGHPHQVLLVEMVGGREVKRVTRSQVKLSEKAVGPPLTCQSQGLPPVADPARVGLAC